MRARKSVRTQEYIIDRNPRHLFAITEVPPGHVETFLVVQTRSNVGAIKVPLLVFPNVEG
jgi:hypothetical protein